MKLLNNVGQNHYVITLHRIPALDDNFINSPDQTVMFLTSVNRICDFQIKFPVFNLITGLLYCINSNINPLVYNSLYTNITI